MKFIRRQALTPHTRIDMVRLAWLNQGIYGKMTQIAQDYHISSTFLSQLIWAVVYLAAADKYRGLTLKQTLSCMSIRGWARLHSLCVWGCHRRSRSSRYGQRGER